MPTPDKLFKGIDSIGQRDAASYVMGYNDTTHLDASSSDATPPTDWDNCRCLSVDGDGIIKIDYKNEVSGNTITEVKVVKAGLIYPIRNVIRLYRLYKTGTAGTALAYKSSGDLTVNAIKLHR